MTRYVAVIITARGPVVTAKVAPGLGSTMAAGKLVATVMAARRDRAAAEQAVRDGGRTA
jgi:hypothetical protein